MFAKCKNNWLKDKCSEKLASKLKSLSNRRKSKSLPRSKKQKVNSDLKEGLKLLSGVNCGIIIKKNSVRKIVATLFKDKTMNYYKHS